MMDREGMRSKRNDNGNETIIFMEFTSTGNSSEVLTSSASEVGGERGGDELEGGRRKSMSFRLSGRPNSKSTNKVKRVRGKGKKDGYGEKRGAMMVVSVLIATLTYQVALNPPHGFWQDDHKGSTDASTIPRTTYITSYGSSAVQEAGAAINREFNGYQAFLIANTVGLFSSLVIILLLTSAITIRRQIMMWLLMFIMWVSVFSVAFSFVTGAFIILGEDGDSAGNYLLAFVLCCAGLFVLLVILHMVVGFRRVYRWAKKKPTDGEEV